MTRARIDTHAIGSVVVPCYVPRGTGRTGGVVLKSTRVLYHAGETPADAEAFAAAQRASVEAYRASHPSQPGTGRHADGTTGRAQHSTGGATVDRLRDDRGLDDLVARFRASRGLPQLETVAKVAPVVARKPRARKVAPVAPVVAPEPVRDPETEAEAWALSQHTMLRHAGPWLVCAVSVCVDARTVAPEPVAVAPEPVQVEPVALPVAVALPARDARPTCPRCGQTFRLSGTGYAWHLANRPDCAAKVAPVAPSVAA